jgi:hypothetical protein
MNDDASSSYDKSDEFDFGFDFRENKYVILQSHLFSLTLISHLSSTFRFSFSIFCLWQEPSQHVHLHSVKKFEKRKRARWNSFGVVNEVLLFHLQFIRT